MVQPFSMVIFHGLEVSWSSVPALSACACARWARAAAAAMRVSKRNETRMFFMGGSCTGIQRKQNTKEEGFARIIWRFETGGPLGREKLAFIDYRLKMQGSGSPILW